MDTAYLLKEVILAFSYLAVGIMYYLTWANAQMWWEAKRVRHRWNRRRRTIREWLRSNDARHLSYVAARFGVANVIAIVAQYGVKPAVSIPPTWKALSYAASLVLGAAGYIGVAYFARQDRKKGLISE